MDDFLILSTLTGLATSFATAPMGCFLLWRRMAFFADTLGHSAILGVALGVFFHINPLVSTIIFVLGLSIILMRVTEKRSLPVDTWLSIIAYTSLSLAMIVLSLAPTRLDPEKFLFGDILLSRPINIITIFTIGVMNAVFFKTYWQQLVIMSLNEGLATVEGVPVKRLHYALTALLSLTIAVSMKVVGALLIPALLILPAATAHATSKTPQLMVMHAVFYSICFVIFGVWASVELSIPTGPAIICMGTCIFLIVSFLKRR